MSSNVPSGRAPADSSTSGHFSKKNSVSAREFLAVADGLVDAIEADRLHDQADSQPIIVDVLSHL